MTRPKRRSKTRRGRRFIDAREAAKMWPDVFGPPPRKRIAALQPGDRVLIGIKLDVHSVLMEPFYLDITSSVSIDLLEGDIGVEADYAWVHVLAVENERITGRVLEDLEHAKQTGIGKNHQLIFEKRHVFKVKGPDEELEI